MTFLKILCLSFCWFLYLNLINYYPLILILSLLFNTFIQSLLTLLSAFSCPSFFPTTTLLYFTFISLFSLLFLNSILFLTLIILSFYPYLTLLSSVSCYSYFSTTCSLANYNSLCFPFFYTNWPLSFLTPSFLLFLSCLLCFFQSFCPTTLLSFFPYPLLSPLLLTVTFFLSILLTYFPSILSL